MELGCTFGLRWNQGSHPVSLVCNAFYLLPFTCNSSPSAQSQSHFSIHDQIIEWLKFIHNGLQAREADT